MARAGLIVACLALLGSCAAASPQYSVAAPLFAWATNLGMANKGQRVSHEVLDDFGATLRDLVSQVVQPADHKEGAAPKLLPAPAEQPDVLLVILGSQLKTSDVRRSSQGKLLRPLQALLDASQSSTVLPYVLHQVDQMTKEGAADDMVAELQAAAQGAKVVKCHDPEQLGSATQQAAAEVGPTVLLFSTSVEAELRGTPAGLAAELQQVEGAHAAVAAQQKRQVTLYAVRPQLQDLHQQLQQQPLNSRRRLAAAAAVAADVGVCGQLCRTQVKWLEGIMALFILTIAALAGMCCLSVLDTPTRFETPKETDRRSD